MENSNALVLKSSFEDVEKVAGAMVKSGYFQDAKEVSQAIVKILAGAEMGIGAFQSMQSIYIIQGRPSMSANLMAAKVKSSRRYNYRIIRLDDTECDLLFFEDGKEAGHSVFTLKDAQKAGTKNLDKYPRNMLFSRAMSNGVRWYCPDVLGAAAVYTPEELGANVAEDGTVIDVQPVNVVQTAEQTAVITENRPEVPAMEYEKAKLVTNSQGKLYIDLDTPVLVNMANSITKKLNANDGTPEETDERQYKLAAIRCILQKRSEHVTPK